MFYLWNSLIHLWFRKHNFQGICKWGQKRADFCNNHFCRLWPWKTATFSSDNKWWSWRDWRRLSSLYFFVFVLDIYMYFHLYFRRKSDFLLRQQMMELARLAPSVIFVFVPVLYLNLCLICTCILPDVFFL